MYWLVGVAFVEGVLALDQFEDTGAFRRLVATPSPSATRTSCAVDGYATLIQQFQNYSIIIENNATLSAKNAYKPIVIGGFLERDDSSVNIQISSNFPDSGPSYVGSASADSLENIEFKTGVVYGAGSFPSWYDWNLIQTFALKTEDLDNVSVIDQDDSDLFTVKDGVVQVSQTDIFDGDLQAENNGYNVVVFLGSTPIRLILDDKGRDFGPSIIAPFCRVVVSNTLNFVDGFIVATDYEDEDNSGLALHGDGYSGEYFCTSSSTSVSPTPSDWTQTDLNPVPLPSTAPTPMDMAEPTSYPSPLPTPAPSPLPCGDEDCAPTSPVLPTPEPTPLPTPSPSSLPCGADEDCTPTQPILPTPAPSPLPTPAPSRLPVADPSSVPSAPPTSAPSSVPLSVPSASPTSPPSSTPVSVPSIAPMPAPSSVPFPAPSTAAPSIAPIPVPSSVPIPAPSTAAPSIAPIPVPSTVPVPSPSTAAPSIAPMPAPSSVPIPEPSTAAPSIAPIPVPSSVPVPSPSTAAPSIAPIPVPSSVPMPSPSTAASSTPTSVPNPAPSSRAPVPIPSSLPSAKPSASPSGTPSVAPSIAPWPAPTVVPQPAPSTTAAPTGTGAPTLAPSPYPSLEPTAADSYIQVQVVVFIFGNGFFAGSTNRASDYCDLFESLSPQSSFSSALRDGVNGTTGDFDVDCTVFLPNLAILTFTGPISTVFYRFVFNPVLAIFTITSQLQPWFVQGNSFNNRVRFHNDRRRRQLLDDGNIEDLLQNYTSVNTTLLLDPTFAPTIPPTEMPSKVPTVAPTVSPTEKPSEPPTVPPTIMPSEAPTASTTCSTNYDCDSGFECVFASATRRALRFGTYLLTGICQPI